LRRHSLPQRRNWPTRRSHFIGSFVRSSK
jgi:hypothetical protein